MNDPNHESLADYYRDAQSWSADLETANEKSRKIAWIVAAAAALIAIMEALALILLVPLKTTVPYTLLVDKQTGFVQPLSPAGNQVVTADEALVRSFLAQYVVSREGFDIGTLRGDYRKVALWSSGEARRRYIAEMQASNPASPLASLPRQSIVDVEVRSISSISDDTAMVRFSATRTDPGGLRQTEQPFVAVVKYRFSSAPMSAADRLVNPLGFQVLRYRKNAESLPEQTPVRITAPAQSFAPAQSEQASDMTESEATTEPRAQTSPGIPNRSAPITTIKRP
jgi:type IV secretion system protein VirB8